MLSSEWDWETAFKVYGEERFEDGFEKGLEEGRLLPFLKMVTLGRLSIEEAIGLAGVSKPTFLESMHKYFPDYNPPI